tara:strand:- start:2228 stop:2707 length:480 start_codon:yes stop_codon:yes gene_type:complete
MPYTVKFLDHKLYQSISFDADMKFPNASDYTKKIWVLKEYKKQQGNVELLEGEEPEEEAKFSHSSYSLNKYFQNDELVVELIQSFTVSDNFDFFAKADLDKETGDEDLDKILCEIGESDFDESVIKAYILDSLLQGEYPQKPKDSEASDENPEEDSESE